MISFAAEGLYLQYMNLKVNEVCKSQRMHLVIVHIIGVHLSTLI